MNIKPDSIDGNFYRSFVMASPVAMMTYNADAGVIVYGNQAAINMLAAAHIEEILSRKPWDFTPEKQPNGGISREIILGNIAVGLAQGNCLFELVLKRLNGTEFDAEVLVSRVEIDGQVYANAIVSDISERKRIESQLIESERRLKNAQALARVGNWELDVASQRMWASEEAYKIYGVDKTHTDLVLADVQKAVLPQYRPMLDRALNALISAGTKYDVEFKIYRKNDGAVRSIHSQAEICKDNTGKAIQVLGVIQDITDFKNVEETAVETQFMLQNIIDLLPVRIFWKDKDLRYLGCNKVFAQDAGKNNPSDLIGKDDFEMGWKDQAELYRADDARVISSGVSKKNYEEPQTTPDGKKIWLISNKVPLTNNDGKIYGVLGTYLNITEFKLAEDELKTKNKELELLNSSMIDRELKMVELKDKLNKLKEKSD